MMQPEFAVAHDGDAQGQALDSRRELAADADLEASLGLAPPLEFAGVSFSDKGDTETSDDLMEARDEEQDSLFDDEVAGARPPAQIAYDGEPTVATKRLFVTIELSEETAHEVEGIVARLRERFPLDTKQLDSVVRWVEPGVMHITLHTLEVEQARLIEAQVGWLCEP